MKINFFNLVEKVKILETRANLKQRFLNLKNGVLECFFKSDKTFTRLMYHFVNLIVGLTLMATPNSIDTVMKGIISVSMTIPTWSIGLLFVISSISGFNSISSGNYSKYTLFADGLLPVALWGLLTYYTLVFSKFHYGFIIPHAFWLIIPFLLYMTYPHTEVRKEYG